MLDGEPLFIGIAIGSVEEAFKQAVLGPSPEDKDKVVHNSLHPLYFFFEVTLHHFCGGSMCTHSSTQSISSADVYVLIRLWSLEISGGINLPSDGSVMVKLLKLQVRNYITSFSDLKY